MSHDAITYAWFLFQIIVGYNLFLPVLFFILYTLLPDRKKTVVKIDPTEADYAIIITAFEQTTLLNDVIKSISQLNYSNYVAYVVADNCDISSLNFDDENIVILRPQQILASNTRSHFYAIEHFRRNHERLTIIDSDNLVHPDYLKELNSLFDEGFIAVQGLRKPKNLDTTNSCLDAARDIYYHYYDAKLLSGLGSSTTLSGSGMAFSTTLYEECLRHKDISGAGFDKVLQYEIVKRNFRIAFAPKAIVYDEKTAKSSQLVKQRARWINTWFKYSHFGFEVLYKGFKNFSINQLLFGLILLRPPLFITLVLSLILTGLSFATNLIPGITTFWLVGITCFTSGFAVALIESETNRKIYTSLLKIPVFIFYQIVALFKSGMANGGGLTTKHSQRIDIDEVLRRDTIKSIIL